MKTNSLIALILYMILMVLVPYIIYNIEVPAAILNDAGFYGNTYRIFMIINIDIALSVGYYKISKKTDHE